MPQRNLMRGGGAHSSLGMDGSQGHEKKDTKRLKDEQSMHASPRVVRRQGLLARSNRVIVVNRVDQ